MTAVAKLPAAIRALAEVIRKHGTCPPAALDHVADELTAALSPAELGGVPEAVAIEPNGLVMRGGIAAIGDYAIEKSPGCTRIVNAEFARGWNEARAAMLSTPRAAEAVTVDKAMIERAVNACIQSKGRYSAYHAPETDDEWRAALTAALTPPSAKGE